VLGGRSAEDRPKIATDPLERLYQIVAETVRSEPEAQVGLVDAVADLGDAENYTPEGYERLTELAAELRHIRTRSLGQPLPDLFAEIERVLGIRAEVLARQDPNADGAAGTVHLDRLAEEVHAYAMVPGATLKGMLAYFQLAKEKDKGLTRGEVQVRADRVQILTAHSAKGLEWDVVCVLHAANTNYEDDTTKRVKVDTWVTKVEEIPSSLRGDADHGDGDGGAPVLDASQAENRKELEEAIAAHVEEFKVGLFEETTRLFYVALTRSERVLYVTGGMMTDTGTAGAPYTGLELIAQQSPDCIVEWFQGIDAEDLAAPEIAEGVFPVEPFTHNTQGIREGAALVAQALEQPKLPVETYGEGLWGREVSALIQEQQQFAQPVVEVEIARELTASDMVALRANPDQYARRVRRPVPFKPNAFAKRGTALHQWIEDRYGMGAALEHEQFDTKLEEEISNSELEKLKQAFLNSQWADHKPEFIEHPFEVTVGGHIVRGRMDAVFRGVDTHDGWMVVDWKTGRPPKGADMRAAMVQLAVYRHAWAKLQGINPAEVRAAFHYVGWNHTFEPDYLPQLKELEAMLQ
ncbi:MAG: 3'-5' exonuclease, partial [Corynebacterium sp.]|nr:3'-5' exonuclease [Corynebacterium sp.]